MVAEERAAVPAALMSMSSVWEIAFRNISRSSLRLISQGLLRFARDGSMRTFSGGFESSDELGTPWHLGGLVVDHPGDPSGGIYPVGDVALGDEDVAEGYGDDLGL